MNRGASETTTQEQIQTRLKKSSSHVSTYKKRLMDAGVIEETILGDYKFALPRFGEYLQKRNL